MYVRVVQNNAKFINIDILQFMGEIVKKHTTHYQSDFEIDKQVLVKAASKQGQQDRIFIWMCRKHGTWLLNERDVFLKDTKEYNTFTFYMEQTNEPVLAFVVEVTEACNGTVYGNIYAINYESFYKHVHDKALVAAYVVMKYECGVRTKDADAVINSFPNKEYGKLQSFQY